MNRETILEIENIRVAYRSNPSGIFSMKDLVTQRKNPFKKKIILEDISFKIYKGSSMGIAGRNGSGKSTLLRAIAGIIQPQSGHIRVHGKIAPILALGAGLEPEMSGYENIQLLLALNHQAGRKEVISSIIQFAELEDATLRQPVKCYSTGMTARLAFSISFANDADIYIIDEILAVGDLGFQSKCIQRIKSLQKAGKTLLFVSHAPEEMRTICDQAILLDNGKLVAEDTADAIVQLYKNLFVDHVE